MTTIIMILLPIIINFLIKKRNPVFYLRNENRIKLVVGSMYISLLIHAFVIYAPVVARIQDESKPYSVAFYDQPWSVFLKASKNTGVDPTLLSAIAFVESKYDANASGSSGEVGMGQLMPYIIEWCGIGNPKNAVQNMTCSGRLLQKEYDRFGSWSKAISAYNAGSPAINDCNCIPNPEYVNAVAKKWAELSSGWQYQIYQPGTRVRVLDDSNDELPGDDFLVACGTPIFAPASGKIITGVDGVGNPFLRIESTPFHFTFLHGEYISRSSVQVGDQIGITGNHGNSSQCHDHVTIKRANEFLNPEKILLVK